MDANTLKELIKQVAVIKERKPSRTANDRLKKEWITETDPLTGEEVQIQKDIPLTNETLGFELVRLKPQRRACELGCGRKVDNQVIEKRFCAGPEPHWRTRCQNCGNYKHPSGVGFIEGAHVVAAEYIKWFNYLNGVAKGATKEVMTKAIEQIRSKRAMNISKEPYNTDKE